MKKKITQDEFFSNQPELTFIDELKKPVHSIPPRFDRKISDSGEVSANGLYIDMQFPDTEGLLDTVLEDFSRFISLCGAEGNRFPIILKEGKTECFESYYIEINEAECIITAADTEGIRRGLIYIEDELIAREGPFLPIGKIYRKPWLRDRITRGFFSPTNRPPKNGDELLDDIDYYPDEYLNRLMHDGTNGLWIYSSFSQLIPSDIFEDFGKNHEKRIEKLNRVISRCKKYGINVYIFAIEPFRLTPEEAEKHPDMIGQAVSDGWSLCPHSELTQKHCFDAGEKLFTLCPELHGFISITAGERPTSCASPKICTCPRCANIPRGKILAKNIDNLFRGMHKAKPEAKCVSWTYGHRVWQDSDIIDYVESAPENAYLLQNFDDRGFEMQLGRERQAMDYWLSYIGPSELFYITADAAKNNNKHLWAKMQICCSHEIATLPYIPSPGHVFGKLQKAKELGVEGIMESWYFGNYPCFMSKAVGDLAFCENMEDEKSYLIRLASITFGRTAAEKIVKAWQKFKEGYSQYPINIMFSYYSPAHDSVVWELSLKPKNLPPSRSWLLLDKPNGDRLCDCLLTSHTLDEAITLFSSMKESYTLALNELSSLKGSVFDDLLSVSNALFILCKSTLNTLRFYKLRDMLGCGEGEPHEILSEMRNIVLSEMEESRAMIALCKKDGRLGYHSEAEGYKFFPEKLEHRIKTLEELLDTEFKEVEKRIADGLAPLEYYLGIEEDCEHSYIIKPDYEAYWEELSHNLASFRIATDEKDVIIDLRCVNPGDFDIQPEFRLFEVFAGIKVTLLAEGECKLYPLFGKEHWPTFKPEQEEKALSMWRLEALPRDEEGRYRARLRVSKKDAKLRGKAPFKLSIAHFYKISNDPERWQDSNWETEPNKTQTLGKYQISPGCFGWVKFQ